jgi:NAD(P)-dependent dehydrogenase (short-subunit alcohol dehydrogenase family)
LAAAPPALSGHAFVTGGGTGIGAAIARTLAAAGAAVTLAGRREGPLAETAATIPGAAVATVDVTDRAAVDQALDQARAAHGPITILVANAGQAATAPFARSSFADWRRLMEVNLDALHHLAQAALPDLLAAPAGRFVTIASTAGLKGYAYAAAYSAAKHGAIGFTRALAVELANTSVTANAVCPGFTETELVAQSIETIMAKTGRSADAARADLARFNPQGRLIQPQEVADAVLFLCGPGAPSVTGQAIVVAGGEVM